MRIPSPFFLFLFLWLKMCYAGPHLVERVGEGDEAVVVATHQPLLLQVVEHRLEGLPEMDHAMS